MHDNIGKRIKERRIALGLSQTELARRAGYADKSGISKIESGDRDLVPAKIERFAEALGCDPQDLLSDVWTRPIASEHAFLLSTKEAEIISRLRNLSPEARSAVIRVIDAALDAWAIGGQ